MNKLFLHIGTQKTGTTSIQAVLSENRECLISLGFDYPAVEPEDRNTASHYNSFRGFFSTRVDQIASTDRFIARISRSERDLILSAECLSAWPARAKGQKLSDLWLAKREIVGKIRASFPNHDATVILYTRNVPDFMDSLYRQFLKVTGKPDSPAEYDMFLSREGHLMDYQSEIACWRSGFDDVQVVDYDAIASSVTAFCEIVGLPAFEDRRENVSGVIDNERPQAGPATVRRADLHPL